MLKNASFFLLLLGVASAKPSANEKPAKCDPNPQQITLDADQHAYINCQTNWTSLDVTIDGRSNTNGGLSLNFHSLTNMKNSDSFSVYAENANNSSTVVYQGIPQGAVWLLTGQTKIRIAVKNEKNTAVSVKVMLSCGGTLDLPTFVSPLLPNKPLPSPVTTTCEFKFTKPASISFTKFTVAGNSQVSFKDTDNDALAGPFSSQPPEHVVIVKANTLILLMLDLSKPDQIVSFNKAILSGDVCGQNTMALIDKTQQISVKGTAAGNAVSCLWLLAASDNQKKLTVDVKNMSLRHTGDIVTVVDGGESFGTPLLEITTLNKKLQPAISSQRYVLVALDSKEFNSDEEFSFTVSPLSAGGHLVEHGSMTISDTSNYVLTTSESSSLVVSFTTLVKLNDSQMITVSADGVELVTFQAGRKLFDLTSPGSQLQVQATGFPPAGFTVDFTSKPKGSGCGRTFTAPQESALRLIGSCDGQCSWIVKPNVPPNVNELFMRVLPNNVPSGTITHFSDAFGKVTLANSAEPFVISYNVAKGALVEFDCSNAKDFEMSYVTKSLSDDLVLTAAAGANLTLTSPFFPGIYPLGGHFDYKVKVSDASISYLASFRIMDLLPSHSLTIGNKSSLLVFSGSTLPGDVLIPASQLTNIAFDTTKMASDVNPKGGYGFLVALTPTSASETLTNEAGSVVIGDHKCSSLRCVYIIDMVMPTEVNQSVSVNLTLAVGGSLKDGDLLVWDGDSVLRSPLLAPIANLTKGGQFASRSNKLIIVYQGEPNITLSYVKSPCSYSSNNMCLSDRTCMPLSWRCDGQLHCSDGSNELECRNGLPPHPKPDPAPASSSGWKVAFWVLMPLFIMLGVCLDRGIPLLMQKLRDSRYHQFHDLGDH